MNLHSVVYLLTWNFLGTFEMFFFAYEKVKAHEFLPKIIRA